MDKEVFRLCLCGIVIADLSQVIFLIVPWILRLPLPPARAPRLYGYIHFFRFEVGKELSLLGAGYGSTLGPRQLGSVLQEIHYK